MANQNRNAGGAGRWGFFKEIGALMSAFPQATTGQKAMIVGMALCAALFMGVGLIGSVALPAWAVVLIFIVASIFILTTAAGLLYAERTGVAPFRCRHFPIYPLDAKTRKRIKDALEEVRKDFSDQLRIVVPEIADDRIRANIFLLAQITGGPSDGTWKLVIHPDFAINMDHPPERNVQFKVGQGATGVTYRDGTYQLTRRLNNPKQGDWEQKFQMTPELDGLIHKSLKWIVTMPLLLPNTSESIGVVNVDGLYDVLDDNLLHTVASSVREKLDAIAHQLSLQPSTCIGNDKLEIM